MKPDVGHAPNCDVRVFPFYNFKCLTGCENRKCTSAWEVVNFWHIWGTESFRLDKQMYGFNGVLETENRRRRRSNNVEPILNDAMTFSGRLGCNFQWQAQDLDFVFM